MNKKILVTNIQRFSLQDGPGIRTTVFLKGCSVRCPWCSNPENLEPYVQKYKKNETEGVYGKWYSSEELFQELISDKDYFIDDNTNYYITDPNVLNKLPGGVTFSGGECLLQMGELENVLYNLHSETIHVSIETSLFANIKQLEIALKYVDLFYVDIKILDKKKCREILKADLDTYNSNFTVLMKSYKPIVARIPVIAGFTDDSLNVNRVCEFLGNCYGNLLKVEIIKGHDLGKSKYQSLQNAGVNIHIPHYIEVNDRLLFEYKKRLEKQVNVPVEICKI